MWAWVYASSRNRIYWENGLLAETTYWWHGVYDRMRSVAIVICRTDSDVFVLYLIITIVWMFITMIVCRTYRNEATVRNDERLYDTHHIFAFRCSFYLSLSLLVNLHRFLSSRIRWYNEFLMRICATHEMSTYRLNAVHTSICVSSLVFSHRC